jgi:hypothetical protein
MSSVTHWLQPTPLERTECIFFLCNKKNLTPQRRNCFQQSQKCKQLVKALLLKGKG